MHLMLSGGAVRMKPRKKQVPVHSKDALSNGSYLENPTVDGPSVDLKQIDTSRLNNKEVIWGTELHQDSDYTGNECDTFNDR